MIGLIVSEIKTDVMEVTKFGDREPSAIPGRTRVTFSNGPDSFDLDWTYRGEPPAVGSSWRLAEVL